MRTTIALLSVGIIVSGCANRMDNSSVSESERQMAEMMGISVEELRRQTPEQHMRMMQDMMNGNGHTNTTFPEDVDVSSLPEVRASEILRVRDGETVTLVPQWVRMTRGGVEYPMYGYNGQIPGPMIEAPQGATITVNVTNDIDQETTVHWHGLRLDNAFDGVPGVTQEAIQQTQSFSYTVTFPDEGLYWYHPHVREDLQQDAGLYGSLLVRPTDATSYSFVDAEQFLILDDTVDGEASTGDREPTHVLMGRFGDVLLVNNQTYTDLSFPRGSVVRFYLTNVANTRTFNIRFGGARMKRVGSDVGRYEHEEFVDSITIAPAERYIVDVEFMGDEDEYVIEHVSPLSHYALGRVRMVDTPSEHESRFEELKVHDDVIADIDRYRQYFDRAPDKTLRLTIDMNGMMNHNMMMGHADDGIEWEDAMPHMNSMMSNDDLQWKLVDEETGKENMDIKWVFQKGDVVKVRIVNYKNSAHPMQHPIHFHGQRFLVLSMDGMKTENLVWKDTVLVPAGATADILIDMANPGEWMFHCHIAEHLTNGMMGSFTVTE